MKINTIYFDPWNLLPRDIADTGRWLMVTLELIVIIVGASFVLLTCLVMPAVILLSIVLLPFGAESALAGLVVEVSVETVPSGIWAVHQFGPTAGRDARLSLMHSASYTDERVLRLIASWISHENTAAFVDQASQRSE